jgi:UDP-glucose 4-epimerase
VTTTLVTGGAGFIGAHLANRLLQLGHHVDIVDNFSRAPKDDVIARLQRAGHTRVLERDLRRRGALDDVAANYDYIVHLAGIVGVAKVQEHPYDVLRDNILMTEQVLALARRQTTLRRFLFASTSEVYSGSPERSLPVPTPESTSLALPSLARPRTSYMLSKIYGEAMCRHAALPFTILRPHNVYGPRMGFSHVIPELLQRAHAANDGQLEVFSVRHRRTFCYVDDAVEMILRAAESTQCEGETLNIGTQEPEVTIGDLAALIVNVVGKDLEIVPRPPTPGSPERRCPDMSKTTALTGYGARIGLEEGVARTYDAYRRQGFQAGALLPREATPPLSDRRLGW